MNQSINRLLKKHDSHILTFRHNHNDDDMLCCCKYIQHGKKTFCRECIVCTAHSTCSQFVMKNDLQENIIVHASYTEERESQSYAMPLCYYMLWMLCKHERKRDNMATAERSELCCCCTTSSVTKQLHGIIKRRFINVQSTITRFWPFKHMMCNFFLNH